MANPDELRLLERIFQLSDKDKDGRLSVDEFTELVRVTNPDATLEASQLDLIVEHVWTHVARLGSQRSGLEFDNLKSIYQSGLADVRRDYDYVQRAYSMEKEEEASQGKHHDRGDISTCNKTMSFVVHIAREDCTDVGKEDVRVALEKALPEGIRGVRVDEPVQTYPGICFDVSCFYKDGEISKDELEYVKAVMEVEPHQAFSESRFGDSVTVSMFDEADKLDSKYTCGSDVYKAASLMGSSGYQSFAFAIEMGDLEAKREAVMDSLQRILPRGAAAMITRDELHGDGDSVKRVLTFGCRVPIAKGRIARDLITSLQGNVQAVLPECGNAKLLGLEKPREQRPILAYTFSLKNSCDHNAIMADLKAVLPPGSFVSLSTQQADQIGIIASIPTKYSTQEVDKCKYAPEKLREWCRSYRDISRVDVSDGCSMFEYSDLENGSFGIPLEEQFRVEENQHKAKENIPEHDGPLRLDDSDDDDIGIISPPKNSLIAGYQRRSPSTSGSSGLVEALDNVHIEVSSPDKPVEKESNRLSTVISIHAYPPDAAPVLQEQTPKPAKSKGWRGLLKSLSPSKKKKSGNDGQENVDKHIQGDAADVAQLTKSPDRRRLLDTFEAREKTRLNAIMDANIKQIVSQAEFLAQSSSGNLGKSLESVQNAAMLLPSWACHTACMDVAEILIKSSRFEEARPFLVEATRAMPENAVAYFRLGNTFFGLRDFDTAARHYYEAIKRSNKDDKDFLSKVHINMGIALESLGNLPAAEREYAKAAEMSPDHHRVHKLLGSVRYALGQYDEAAAALEHALRIIPDFADAWADLGCVRISLDNKKEAVRCFKMALASDEDNLEAHFNLGNLLREMSKSKEAVEHYDRVLKQDPCNPLALLGKAVALSMIAEKSSNDDYRRKAVGCLRKCLNLCREEDVLRVEIQRLCKLVKGSATARQISNQLSVVEDAFEDGSALKVPRENGSPSERENTAGISSGQGNSRPSKVSDAPSQSMSRTMSMASVQSGIHPSDRSYDRLCHWNPMNQVIVADFSGPVTDLIKKMLGEDGVQNILAKLDVPLLQTLQPLTTLTFESLKHMVSTPPSHATSPSKQNKSKVVRKIHAKDLLGILEHLIQPRSPPHLTSLALGTLQKRVFPILDVEGNGLLNLSIVVAMLSIFVDASGRERLGYAYRLLMTRTAYNSGGENLITRSDSVEFLASLKAVFEREHNKRLLVQVYESNNRDSLTQGSRFVMYEKFTRDMEAFFSEFEVIPLLCNPLQ